MARAALPSPDNVPVARCISLETGMQVCACTRTCSGFAHLKLWAFSAMLVIADEMNKVCSHLYALYEPLACHVLPLKL